MKLSDKILYELWYIYCEGGGPFYDLPASEEMTRNIQENCSEQEFLALIDLLMEAPAMIEYNGRKINAKEAHHQLWHGLANYLLGNTYRARFAGNKEINDHIASVTKKHADNRYLLEFIGHTGNLDFIKLLGGILSKKNKNDIRESMALITETHYDKFGLNNEEPVLQMLKENSGSPFYNEIVQSIEHDREAVRTGILYQKQQ